MAWGEFPDAGVGGRNLWARWVFLFERREEDLAMPTASHKQAQKQAMKRAAVQPSNRRMREARRLRRATRRQQMAAGTHAADDILVDRDFHDTAEEIEIDPQLDDSESAEP